MTVHVFTVSDYGQSEPEMKSRLVMVEAAFNKKKTLPGNWTYIEGRK